MTVYLRFSDQGEALLALSPWIVGNVLPTHIGTAAVDVLGVVLRPSGEVQQTADGEVVVMEPVLGWHINLSERVSELREYEIDPPTTPDRVFAGSDVPLRRVFPVFMGNAKLDLFSHAEQLAVVSATMSDPLVKLMYDRLLGAAYLTYSDPETEQGLSLLLARGLITSDRKAEIVAAMQPA